MARRSTARPHLVALVLLVVPLLAALFAARPVAAETEGLACGHVLSAPVFAKWQMLGAQGGLGCPAGPEAAGSNSPQGTRAAEADFTSGMILWHASGPRAGQTFAVTGCIFRLYFQYGGASGWLGLPTGDPTNTPDGQRQSFEGGRATYLRAPNACTAEPNAEIAQGPPQAAQSAKTSPLDAFFDPARGDHLSIASGPSVRTALAANYRRVGAQAFVLDDTGPSAARLKLFWNQALGDHMTVATAEGELDALARGYEFEASQGFVWTDPHPGARALKQYRNAATGHSWLIATSDEEANAMAAGFAFVRIEGYAPAP